MMSGVYTLIFFEGYLMAKYNLFIRLTEWLRYRWIKNILAYFGEHSTYIWLTHTFFAYYYFQNLILLPRYSVLIYLWLVVISLLTSIILSGIYHILEKLKCQFMRELGNA